MSSGYLKTLEKITTFIFDVDGVLTNGSVFLLPGGEPIRVMNIKDGYALQLAVKRGYNIAIISGGKSEEVRKRFNNLGIQDVFLGADDKLSAYKEYILTYNLSSEEILYMGDDIPDIEVMQRVALPACPSDAATEIIQCSKYISALKGGEGCVRDIIEKVMKVQGKWFDSENDHDENGISKKFRW
jgi:3-deoxy-D-manno-octulosonate 8-phosphate phosphatase (KDO 8-P phosphatase)